MERPTVYRSLYVDVELSKNPGDWNTMAGIPEVDCVGCHSRGKVYSELFFQFDLRNVKDEDIRYAAQRSRMQCEMTGRQDCTGGKKRSTRDPITTIGQELEVQRAARRSWKPRKAHRTSMNDPPCR